ARTPPARPAAISKLAVMHRPPAPPRPRPRAATPTTALPTRATARMLRPQPNPIPLGALRPRRRLNPRQPALGTAIRSKARLTTSAAARNRPAPPLRLRVALTPPLPARPHTPQHNRPLQLAAPQPRRPVPRPAAIRPCPLRWRPTPAVIAPAALPAATACRTPATRNLPPRRPRAP